MTTPELRPLQRAPTIILAAATVVALLLLASRASFVPLWDGRAYTDCAIDAAHGGFRPFYLRCYQHSSLVYVTLLGVAHRLVPDTVITFHVVHAAMLGAAAIAFHRLIRLAFPAPALAVERAALTATFLVQPAFLAMVVQPNLDLPVLAGMLWCIVTLLERRWAWTILVATLAVFSKETTVLLYGLLIGCYGLWQLASEPGSLGRRVRTMLPLAPLAIPLALFGAYVAAFVILRPNTQLFWLGFTSGGSMLHQFLVPQFTAATYSYVLMVIALNFAWIPAAFVLTDATIGAVRLARRQQSRMAVGADRGLVRFLTVLAVVFTYFLTRFATFSNVRYLAVAIALISLVFLAALLRLRLPVPARRIVLGVYGALLVVSCVRTVDPVSRIAFGTFSAGSRQMLDLTRLTGECCQTYGRDQLAYSLEFTVFNDLMNAGLAAVAAADSTAIIIPDHGDWYLVGTVDRASRRRTIRRSDVVRPRVTEVPMLEQTGTPRSQTAWYFALPNNEAAEDLRTLSSLYDVGPEQRLSHDGYSMSVFRLTLRTP